MPTPPRPRRSAAALERATLARGPSDTQPEAQQAAARFDALPTAAARMALVREIVATRARELTLAYRSVAAVLAGYKARSSPDGETLHAEPCVVFVVKRKWATPEAGTAQQRLPARLLSFGPAAPGAGAGVDGAGRVLYAVPTDVQPARRYLGARAQASGCITVADPDPVCNLPGTLTCWMHVHNLSGAAPQSVGLSAMHVLSPVPHAALPAEGAGFTAFGTPPVVRGSSLLWGGRMDLASGQVFDAQCAAMADSNWLDTAYAGWQLSASDPFLTSPAALDRLAPNTVFRVLVADNHPASGGAARPPVLAQFRAMVGAETDIAYQVRRNGQRFEVPLHHAELIVLQLRAGGPTTLSGDSGSAVLATQADGSIVFVGMHIAAAQGLSYVLPAWQLFDPARWSALPAGTVALVPSFQR
jgi:hypothetical protein